MQPRAKALWTVALLSPIFGELVTGSTAPVRFLNPLSLLYVGLYGGGVLLIREFLVRFNKGPASLVALGLAFGIYLEALVVHSWFDFETTNAQLLGTYGRVAGINAVWVVWVSPWLGIIAIAMPILIGDLLYPELRGQPYLTKPELGLWFAAAAAVFAVANAPSAKPAPGAPEFALACLLVVACIAAAVYLPRELLQPRATAATRTGGPFLVFGAFWAGFQFTMAGIGPAAGLHPAVAAFIIVAGWAVGFFGIERLLVDADWRHHLFLFFAGVLAFFALRDILSAGSPETVGLRAVGAVYLYWVYRLHRRLWPPEAAAQVDEADDEGEAAAPPDG